MIKINIKAHFAMASATLQNERILLRTLLCNVVKVLLCD